MILFRRQNKNARRFATAIFDLRRVFGRRATPFL
jgi:hypothetical protein